MHLSDFMIFMSTISYIYDFFMNKRGDNTNLGIKKTQVEERETDSWQKKKT